MSEELQADTQFRVDLEGLLSELWASLSGAEPTPQGGRMLTRQSVQALWVLAARVADSGHPFVRFHKKRPQYLDALMLSASGVPGTFNDQLKEPK